MVVKNAEAPRWVARQCGSWTETGVITLRASEAASQCIVIGSVCLCVGVCSWVCYHDNSTLRASILTKLGLYR